MKKIISMLAVLFPFFASAQQAADTSMVVIPFDEFTLTLHNFATFDGGEVYKLKDPNAVRLTADLGYTIEGQKNKHRI